MLPRPSSTSPRRSASRSTRFTVAREVSGERREVVLDQRDDDRRRAAVDAAELEHAAGDARLGVDGVGLDEPVGEERDALGEEADEHLVERRMPLREPPQLGAADDERLGRARAR